MKKIVGLNSENLLVLGKKQLEYYIKKEISKLFKIQDGSDIDLATNLLVEFNTEIVNNKKDILNKRLELMEKLINDGCRIGFINNNFQTSLILCKEDEFIEENGQLVRNFEFSQNIINPFLILLKEDNVSLENIIGILSSSTIHNINLELSNSFSQEEKLKIFNEICDIDDMFINQKEISHIDNKSVWENIEFDGQELKNIYSSKMSAIQAAFFEKNDKLIDSIENENIKDFVVSNINNNYESLNPLGVNYIKNYKGYANELSKFYTEIILNGVNEDTIGQLFAKFVVAHHNINDINEISSVEHIENIISKYVDVKTEKLKNKSLLDIDYIEEFDVLKVLADKDGVDFLQNKLFIDFYEKYRNLNLSQQRTITIILKNNHGQRKENLLACILLKENMVAPNGISWIRTNGSNKEITIPYEIEKLFFKKTFGDEVLTISNKISNEKILDSILEHMFSIQKEFSGVKNINKNYKESLKNKLRELELKNSLENKDNTLNKKPKI